MHAVAGIDVDHKWMIIASGMRFLQSCMQQNQLKMLIIADKCTAFFFIDRMECVDDLYWHTYFV